MFSLSLSLFFFFWIYLPRSGIAGSYSSSISVFWETSILSSTPTESVYIPSNSVWRFPFHCILASISYLYSFWSWPCWQMWGDISLWLWFAFSWWLVTLSIFSCDCWPSVFPVWKTVYSGFCPFFIWVGFFFFFFFYDVELYELPKPHF